MTALRMALNELRRLSAGRLPTLAVLAMIVIPTMYAGLYLWANHDPYGRLSQVDAALVVQDEPAQARDGSTLDVGKQVSKDLIKDGSFRWHQVDASQARRGVENGRYRFALTIPRGFSAALASTSQFDPKKGSLILTTNDANNYLSHTFAEQVLTQVSGSISTRVSKQAASSFLLGFSTLHDKLVRAGDGAHQLAAGLSSATDGAHRLAAGASDLSDGERTLLAGQRSLNSGLVDAATGAGRLNDGAQLEHAGVDSAPRKQILARLDTLRQPISEVVGAVQHVSGELDELSSGSQQVAEGAQRLHRASGALASGIGRADDGARRLRDGSGALSTGLARTKKGSGRLVSGQRDAAHGARRLSKGAGDLARGLANARNGAKSRASKLGNGVESIPNLDKAAREHTADAIASPVKTRNVSQASAGSYGAGLAPFFLGLAAWIGAYVMFLLVRPVSARAMAARQSPLRIALAGWLTAALIAVAQVVLMVVVVKFGVGIDFFHSIRVALFLALVGAAFVAIVHALNAWFGAVGQLLGLVLLVLQVSSAGGTFPWQTLHGLGTDIGVLVGYLLAAIALSAVAARKQRIWTAARIKPELAL